MDIKNKDKVENLKDEERSVILPEGYDGGDLFNETGKQAADDAKQPVENGQKQGGVEKAVPGNAAQVNGTVQKNIDLHTEIAALLERYPELREKLAKGEGLPGEVISNCLKNGTGLCAAYTEYEEKRARVEAEQTRRENEILKQNSAAAAKAPVRGTAAGCGVKSEGRDPFLEGLLSDE